MAKLLSIETGFTCNSRCRYCTQLDYRFIPQADRLDLDTEAIKERIRYAAEQGYDQVGFSGGEPTIRSDFTALVRYARGFGFKRVGVTTNGRMFAYRSFAEEALAAGLDGFTVSLHAHTSELHDRITTSPGALEQALLGLDNIGRIARQRGMRVHLMNNQILLPENTGFIKEVVELLAPRGVRLFMIQPFIAQRSNVDELGRFFVPYDDVLASVERALPALRRHGARIKPYNVPSCLLWRFGEEQVEGQLYGIRSFREYERAAPGEFKAFKARQWYRIPECAACEEACPGFRIEHYPQERMAEELVRAADDFATEIGRVEGDGPLLFSGTELMEAETLRGAFGTLAERHGPVAWMTSLCERVPREALAPLICELHEGGVLAELVLIAQPLDQRFLAQRVLEKGNLEELRAGLFMLAEQRRRGLRLPPISVLYNIGDLLRLLEDDVVAPQWPQLGRALDRASGRGEEGHQPVSALIAMSNFPRGKRPPNMRRQADRNRTLARRLAAACRELGMEPSLAVVGDRRGLDAARARELEALESQFAEVLPVVPLQRRLFLHPFSRPEMDFVSWSPPWLFERPGVEDAGGEVGHRPAPEGLGIDALGRG